MIVLALAALSLAAPAVPAGAKHNADAHSKMDLLFTSPNAKINSDFAFWGDHLFEGYYTGDAAPSGGVRIFDISNPASPVLVKDVQCDGLQNDPIVWDRNGNGIADLLLLAVDRTMTAPACGSPRAAHADPSGWEGIRVFTMSDNPANPFATVTQVAAVYQDCGSHTITLWPGEVDAGNLIVYSSSYPLRPGPTCGQVNGPAAGRDPLHGVIQVVRVPLANPAASVEIAETPINYPGDPDNQIDWCERGLCAPGVLEPAARACHDIVVHVEHALAGGACAEQGQVWNIGPGGIPDTANPVMIGDDEFSSGGTGNIPGAVDFFHSVMFNNAATVVNWVDESFGVGCPPMTQWAARPWHPASLEKTGKMFFSDVATQAFLSEFQIGDLRPDADPAAYCSAHMGMAVMDIQRDLLVNAWYTGGVDVIDFSKPTSLKEIAYYDIAGGGPSGSDNWSAYPYVGPRFQPGGKKGKAGIPVYASDGVHTPPTGRGLLVLRALLQQPKIARDHLNPQTMD